MADNTCGHLIKGDESRPCVRKLDHKAQHRDQVANDKELARNREYHKNNLDVVAARRSKYYEANPEKLVAKREYERQASSNYRSINREKVAATKQAYVEANRDKVRSYLRTYMKAHPELQQNSSSRRRARERSAFHEDWTRAQVSALYGSVCYLCGGLYEHTDHVIPLVRGGWDALPNLRPSCASCNYKKNAKMPSVKVTMEVLLLMRIYVGVRCGTLLAGLARSD